jgi:hypothetical protein
MGQTPEAASWRSNRSATGEAVWSSCVELPRSAAGASGRHCAARYIVTMGRDQSVTPARPLRSGRIVSNALHAGQYL